MALERGGLVLLGFVQVVDDGCHRLSECHALHGLCLLRAAIPKEPVPKCALERLRVNRTVSSGFLGRLNLLAHG